MKHPSMLSVAFRTLCDREGVDYEVAEDGCWNWLRGKNAAGYAWGHKHRKYWSTVNGPIPEGFHVHHLCHNPSCVNPDHLEPREPRQHLAEHRRAESPHSLELVLEIRERAAAGSSSREIAEALGLNADSVNEIASGRNWKDVGGPIGTQPRDCAFDLCAKPLPMDRRRDRKYCNSDCRVRAERLRRGVRMRPWQWKENNR